MKCVFLDIDGPLNTRSYRKVCYDNSMDFYITYCDAPVCKLDPKCISNINTLIESTGAKLVICSSWRLSIPLFILDGFLKSQGLVHDIYSYTSDLESDGKSRGDEILEFISNSKSTIDNWIVIDDTILELINLNPNNIIHVDHNTGFNSEHLNNAIRILNID